jgi:hypothetical protein
MQMFVELMTMSRFEFEAWAAEEELITQKQGHKESVRDFISNL